ncbi:MAG: hypothetical protein P4M00_25695 [Azospirillaceae bacterium]|nr:hypothetical protein [Azospirillaceae bacterium]
MQGLKVAIVVMGILIVAGFSVLGVEIYRRIAHPGVPQTAMTAHPLESGVTDVITLDLPEGSRMSDPVAIGARVAIHVTLPQGDDRLFLIDPGTRRVTAILPRDGAAAPAHPAAVPVR